MAVSEKKMKKTIHKMVNTACNVFHPDFVGFMLSHLLVAMTEMADGKDEIEIRSMKVTINDFFEFDVFNEKKELQKSKKCC